MSAIDFSIEIKIYNLIIFTKENIFPGKCGYTSRLLGKLI